MSNSSVVGMAEVAMKSSGINDFWHIFGVALIFMMQIGFTMLEVGSVNIKNTKNILTKNIVNICVSLLTWWAVGYALTYGDSKSGVLGTSHFFVGCDEYPELATASSMPLAQAPAMDEDLSFVLFQWGFASTCATIVSGAVAERIKVEAFAVNTFFMVGIIYPLVAHAVWSRDGWAQITRGDNEWGVIDFAGSGVVHMTGGLCAFVGACIVGPRTGRFDSEGHPVYMVKQSTTLQTLGTLLLWVGWIGFNGCSTITIAEGSSGLIAGRVVLNTLLGGAAGGMGTLATLYTFGWGIDIAHINNGILSGLVSVTAGCSTFHAWGAVIVALLAGPLYLATSNLLVRLQVDDVLDATSVHFFCGAWGVICCGIFPSPRSVQFVYDVESCGLLYLDMQCDGGRQFGNQLLYVVAIISWVGTTSTLLFLGMKQIPGFLRESSGNEEVGIDIARHNGEAYQIQPMMSFPVNFNSTDAELGAPSADANDANGEPAPQVEDAEPGSTAVAISAEGGGPQEAAYNC